MGARILIADDLSFIRLLQREVLTDGGFEVVGEAVNGREAVAMYQALRPDIVMLDITMPEMNGLEAMRRIFAARSLRPGDPLLGHRSAEPDCPGDCGGGQGFHRQAVQAGAAGRRHRQGDGLKKKRYAWTSRAHTV